MTAPQPSKAISTTMPKVHRPFIFGEVLFDCFPERRVLGGAPFNVAWNLRGLGINPLVLTALGNDELGQEVLRRATAWTLDPSGLQVCQDKPTGRVDIETKDGEPSYRFWDDVAFDHIQFDEQLLATVQPALLYHGTLALRSAVSRTTLETLRDRLDCPVFIDVNVRLPHFDSALTKKVLHKADHVKLNHDELLLLTGAARQDQLNATRLWQQCRDLGRQLIDQCRISNLWITAAQQGAAWLGSKGDFLQASAPAVESLVDTVGAGDALSAVIIHGLLNRFPAARILEEGTQYAARICTIRGAIHDDPNFYR